MLTLSVAVTNCSREEAQKAINGINGKDGTAILSGNSTPALNVGNIGDYYFDQSSYKLYGPKKADGWGIPVILKGADGEKGNDGAKGEKGEKGEKGNDGTQIIPGTGAPTPSIGSNGDWYIDTKNKKLYGPKTQNGWGDGFILGNGGSASGIRANYNLDPSGKILLKWLNSEMTAVDMQSDPELKNVTIIANLAFQEGSLESIILPHNLIKIGKKAFTDNQLTSVNIPNNVTSIGDEAFSGNNLTSINIPNSVKTIGYHTFSNNKLTSVNIPNSVTSIGDYAFLSNNLTSVNIPNSVKTIGKSAFSNNKLTSVNIPNSVTSIGDGAFSNNKLTSVNIPNSVKTIGQNAFYDNKLTSVTIPNSVTSIDYYAFLNNNLTSVTIHAVNPPAAGIIFNYRSPTIYVPAQSVNAYKTAEGWKQYADKIFPIQ